MSRIQVRDGFLVLMAALWCADESGVLTIFLLAAAVLYFLDGHLSRSGALSAVWQQYAGVLLLWGLLFTFVWCTYRPPQFPLWQDPLTGGYGIG